MFRTYLPETRYGASKLLDKRINNASDVTYFKTESPAYRNLLYFVDLLCEKIRGTGDKVLNIRYNIKSELFVKCSKFISNLEKLCDEIDPQSTKSHTFRFGYVAFRDWFDLMKVECRKFVSVIASKHDDLFQEELYIYLSESFGNKMRIDYGTGHELNFIIFTLGLSYLVEQKSDTSFTISNESLKSYTDSYGIDILALFAFYYLELCRKLQKKFRLEPAGSRGVYNMDDFQCLPFLFGSAQLSGVKYISTSDFYQAKHVDMLRHDFIFFAALDYILNNKRGPFNEHSYTLWEFTSLDSWDSIARRIRSKFIDDVLSPFPIIQHLLFGKYILRWDKEPSN